MVMNILSYINERKNPPLCSNFIIRYSSCMIDIFLTNLKITLLPIIIFYQNMFIVVYVRA